MACVVWSEIETNLDKNTEAYEFLQEINKEIGYEKVFIKQFDHEDKVWFTTKKYNTYGIYIKINNHEYQRLMCFKGLNLQAIECYLLGYLNGLGK